MCYQVVSACLQRLEEAILTKAVPSSHFLPRMTRIAGFNASDPVVALAAGYMFWLALTAGGRVLACDTVFDGYAGLLPGTERHGGWHVINEVRAVPMQPCLIFSMFRFHVASASSLLLMHCSLAVRMQAWDASSVLA